MRTVLPIALRIALTLLGLFFLLMGLGFMSDPLAMASAWGLATVGDGGISALRGVLGGFFVGLSLLLFWRLAGRRADFFFGLALLESLVVTGRLVSLVIDGPSPGVWIAIGIETFAVVVLLAAARVLGPVSADRSG